MGEDGAAACWSVWERGRRRGEDDAWIRGEDAKGRWCCGRWTGEDGTEGRGDGAGLAALWACRKWR